MGVGERGDRHRGVREGEADTGESERRAKGTGESARWAIDTGESERRVKDTGELEGRSK